MEIIDLSQPIFTGMPVFKGMPEVKITVHATHEEWEGWDNATTLSPSVNRLELSEHTGSHVDALSHMTRQNFGQTIDTMPLSTFYTEGVCLDFSHKKMRELIEPNEVEIACKIAKIKIKQNDCVLFYTDHYRKTYGTSDWANNAGISTETAIWLGKKGVASFGVETMSPGVPRVSNRDVHRICGEMGFTHYENLINLHLLIGRGRFRFIGLPLNIVGGTGSPVRAVAVFE